MIDHKTVTAIVLAAGSSTRFGGESNKNLALLCEKPVLAYSLLAFDGNDLVDDILVAARPEEKALVEELAAGQSLKKPIRVIEGGNSRQQSVQLCLEAAASDYVIIHDGARPMIRQCDITGCLHELKYFRGVTVGVPSKDTVKITDENGVVVSTTCRSNTWLIQTPQAFDRGVLLKCHRNFGGDDSITDDCMLLERSGIAVRVLHGHESNQKITTGDDLKRVRLWMEQSL